MPAVPAEQTREVDWVAVEASGLGILPGYPCTGRSVPYQASENGAPHFGNKLLQPRFLNYGKYLGLCPGKPPTGFKDEPCTLGLKRDDMPCMGQRWVPNWGT
ncbi:MAG: hypothetical protein ACP5JJ_09645 [Anaerolineae bacterium]